MPIVNITTWPTEPAIKRNLMEEITRVINQKTGAPLDKITVYFNEIDPNNWSEGGSIGSDVDFKEKSRRLHY